ncbi:MAG: UDP-3-O-(3-hydroxymyristoyl)glucosamine N-acyltransferase [Bacteroidales bacterium]|nr:UDP-3-O-(3-hydroxymyristoyl)glucosamine N-acyltransferase [Bacteroidales bacterium]
MKEFLTSSKIATFLSKKLFGSDFEIYSYSDLSLIKENSIVFAKKFDEDLVSKFNSYNNLLAIVNEEYSNKLSCSFIISDNPRLDFLRVISKFFLEEESVKSIHPTAIIDDGAIIGLNVSIGPYCYIGKQVIIGDNTTICSNVTITSPVNIGKNCFIKSGAVIGQSGFGFEYNENGIPEQFPHVGTIEIGNNVYIGANTAIDRGTLGCTKISDNVKIDNLVHIAHNIIIEKNSLIIAGVTLCGGVLIGENCSIAPNSTIKQKIKIGRNSIVGLGAVVLKDVEDNSIVVGNPAKKMIK